MIIATAQRPNEVATMCWSDIDRKWWTIPAKQTKNGKELREKMKDFEGVEYFSAHDLRRTAATHMAKLGHGSSVGKILNHTDQSVTAIYDRYSYDKEK